MAEVNLADCFFAADVEGHKDLDGDAAAPLTQIVDSKDSSQRFAIEGAGRVGIRESDEHAHTFGVRHVFGCEVDTVPSRVERGENLVEVEMSVGRPHANHLRKL